MERDMEASSGEGEMALGAIFLEGGWINRMARGRMEGEVGDVARHSLLLARELLKLLGRLQQSMVLIGQKKET